MAGSDLTEEVDEGYFASISDLMVGILFVFLLMLTVFALNFRDAEEKQTVELKRYEQLQREAKKAERRAKQAERKALDESISVIRASVRTHIERRRAERLKLLLKDAVAQLERDIAERQNRRAALLISLKDTLAKRGVLVTVSERSDVLRLPGDRLFRRGSAELDPPARAIIGLLAEALDGALPCSVAASQTPCAEDRSSILDTVLVEGHTDKQPYGKGSAATDGRDPNDDLSTQRALSVFAALRQHRRSLESLTNGDGLKLLAFSGYGSRRPLPDALGDTEADFQRNRRIDVRFVLSTRTSEELQRLRDQIRQALGDGPP